MSHAFLGLVVFSCDLIFLLCGAWLPLLGVTSSLSPLPCTHSLFFVFLSLSLSADKRIERNAGLNEGVTDASLQALAQAGCGENLTSLTLSSECLFLLPLFVFFLLFFFCVGLGPL